MGRYLGKRLASTIPLLLVISFIPSLPGIQSRKGASSPNIICLYNCRCEILLFSANFMKGAPFSSNGFSVLLWHKAVFSISYEAVLSRCLPLFLHEDPSL